jgi:hypothetical protein
MRCESDSLSCTAGKKIYITNCDVDTLVTQWTFNYLAGTTVFQVKDSHSNLCITVPKISHQHLYVDHCNSTSVHQQFTAQNGKAAWGSHFELSPVSVPDGCVGDTHHPKYGESLYIWKCEISRKWTTNAYAMY